MRVSPRSTLILVSICAASLGFAFAAHAEKTPVARYSRMAEAIPWTFVAKTGDMEAARLTIEGMAFCCSLEEASGREQLGSTVRFDDPAAKIDRFAREAATGRDLAENVGLLGLDALNPEAMGLMRAGAATSLFFASRADANRGTFKVGASVFTWPDFMAEALAADGARQWRSAVAGDRNVAELFSIPREDLAKIYTRLWRDSFLSAQGGPFPGADARRPRQVTRNVSALTL